MASKRQRARRDNNVYEIADALPANIQAVAEGPRRKKWTTHDLKHVKPLNANQQRMFDTYMSGQHIVGIGSAGTGKTYLACWLALLSVLDRIESVDHIILIRSAVPTRDVGFLPGTLEEKASMYELPYKDIFADLMGRPTSYDHMKEAGVIQFHTTSYVRGLTWDNAIIIVDEAQNATFHELNSIATRVGSNSRLVVVGDLIQTDLRKKHEETGLDKFVGAAGMMQKHFAVTEFTSADIVRSEFVREWIKACEKLQIT